MFPRLLPIFAIVAIGVPANAQALTGKAQTELLSNARAQYYNLSFLGLKSFSCSVDDIDWNSIIMQTAGSTIPADNPVMVYLTKSRLLVKETVASGAEITWANTGTPPAAAVDSTSQMRELIKQLLDGFFHLWMPNITGELFPGEVTGVRATDKGYLVTENNPKDKSSDTMTFDKAMLLSHISSISVDGSSESDMKYAKTPQGWLLSAIEEVDTEKSPSVPPNYITMQADYQQVDGFQLPGALALTIKGLVTVKLKLSGCVVEKQPK